MGNRITEVFAFCSVDPEDDNEGIVGTYTAMGWMPMVGADYARVVSLRPIAEQIARESGLPVILKRFTNVCVEDVIQ